MTLLQYPMKPFQDLTNALPMPPSRQSLREHCQVNLTIRTPSHNQFLKASSWDYLFQALEPSGWTDCNASREDHATATQLDEVADEHEDNAEDDDELFYTPYESPTDFPPDNGHVWNPLDGLYLAFADDDREVAMLHTREDEPFTHLLRIAYVPENNATVNAREVEEKRGRGSKPHILRLSCPARNIQVRNNSVQQRDRTALSPAQLLAARDFLSLLLPYRCVETPVQMRAIFREQVHSVPDTLEDSGPVRLLIAAPNGCLIDIMSVVMCYLAFTSGKPTDVVTTHVSEVADCDDVWLGDPCMMLGLDGVEYVETVARF